MAYQMIRRTTKFEIDWGDEFEVQPLSEGRKQAIGEFYHRVKSPLYHRPEGGTVEQGVFEVQRHLDYQRDHGDYDLALAMSSLVYHKPTGRLVGVCLVGAGEPDHVGKVLHPVIGLQHIVVDPEFRRRGLGTKMMQHAMTVAADKRPAFDLWVEEDDEDERGLFESLDFVFTGVED